MQKKVPTILSSVVLILALALTSFSNASALQTATVPLHESHIGATNPGFQQGTCPTPPAGQEGWWGWHFVMPNNNNFTSLSVTFQNAGTFSADPFPGSTFVAHPDNSHAYIWTPGPDTLLGGSATSDGANEFFNLSHVCASDSQTETPTPTPTDPPTETPTPTDTPTETPTPTDTPTETPTPTDTPTETPTPPSELGQLKLCKIMGIGVTKGDIFTFTVNGANYNVAAGYCVLAGQYALDTQVTIQETNIPAGVFVERIDVLPDGRIISKSLPMGQVVVKIGTGITEVSFRNATATSTSTKTPIPGTPAPQGYMQVCKQADGTGVSGYFNFRFANDSRSVPVGSCSRLIFNLTPGTLTVTEDARAGYQVADIYTIPADRLISKDLNARSATVTIVPSNGDASTQTVVVFVNRKVEEGQLKLCKVAGHGVIKGQVFNFKVNNVNYDVPAGYCVLAGMYPLNSQVSIKESAKTGFFIERIDVLPDTRTVSKSVSTGDVVVKIGTGITEVSYRNASRTSIATKTPTGTPSPDGYMQICKQAEGAGVSGYFNFRFATQSRSIPVGTCSSLIFNIEPGTLTVTEDARAGYQVADIYTIPADRLVSKNISGRSATVTIVPNNGDASLQTVVVFVNRVATTVGLSQNSLDTFMTFLRNGFRG